MSSIHADVTGSKNTYFPAVIYQASEQFEDAASVYERVVNVSVNSPLTHELLHSYYHGERLDKALKICRTLRQKYGVLNTISAMEAAIYEEIGDLSNAKKIALEYLDSYPEHFGMKHSL